MLHEEPARYVPPGGDVDGLDMAWEGEKRRRTHLSDAPTATAQGHQAQISDVLFGPDKAAKDHQGPVSDTAIVQAQDQALLPRMDSGEEEEETQERFGPHVILTKENQASYFKKLPPDVPPLDGMTMMSLMDNFKVQERQARLRIAYYKSEELESGSKLKDPDAYSENEINDQEYFKRIEKDKCFEWFFHTDDSWITDLGDYQRIVLKNFMPGRIGAEYLDVEAYRKLYHTYEMDAAYVKYYGEISEKIKWIEKYLHLDTKSAEWREMETRGWRQALRIATQLPHMTARLADLAYDEYILELREDASLKDLDLVYYDIWRLVIRDNRTHMEAVKEVQEIGKYPMHKSTMEAELKDTPVFVTMRRRISCIIQGEIFANTEDDKARDLFRKGVARLKKKNMAKYAEKKMEIWERLKLLKWIEIPGPGKKN